MADDNIKGVDNDNVVKGPWKRVKVVNQAKTQKRCQSSKDTKTFRRYDVL